MVYHIEVPGQHADAQPFPCEYEFPSLPKLADRMVAVLERYNLRDVIGLGVGAGAVLMIHLAIAAPTKFLGITVIDPAGKSLGFKEWGEQKLARWQLEKKGFTSGVEEFFAWHLFGTNRINRTVGNFSTLLRHNINTHNISSYSKSFLNRKPITRAMTEQLQCKVLIITGRKSKYKKDAYRLHRTLDKHISSIIVCENTVNAFFEDPDKCGEGMLLLMQGLGLVPTLRTRTALRAHHTHHSSGGGGGGGGGGGVEAG